MFDGDGMTQGCRIDTRMGLTLLGYIRQPCYLVARSEASIYMALKQLALSVRNDIDRGHGSRNHEGFPLPQERPLPFGRDNAALSPQAHVDVEGILVVILADVVLGKLEFVGDEERGLHQRYQFVPALRI